MSEPKIEVVKSAEEQAKELQEKQVRESFTVLKNALDVAAKSGAFSINDSHLIAISLANVEKRLSQTN